MNERMQKCYYRNNAIKRIVRTEAEKSFYDSVDLILINPYANCNYDDKGFNLLVISNKDDFQGLNKCFIMNDKYFLVYNKSWSEIEDLALYKKPDAFILLNFGHVYKKDLDSWYKYINLSETLKVNMNDLNNIKYWISKHFVEILRLYDEILNTDDFKMAFKFLSRIITRCEYILYMLNQKVLPSDLESIQKEIVNLKILPDNFRKCYLDLVKSYSLCDIRHSSLKMIINLKNLLDSLNIPYEKSILESTKEVPLISNIICYDLDGSSEALLFKWKENMYKASDFDNKYLSFMTMAKCQRFYNKMNEKYGLPSVNLISQYNPNDLRWNSKIFDIDLENWINFYKRIGEEPRHYSSVFELEKIYRIEPKKSGNI